MSNTVTSASSPALLFPRPIVLAAAIIELSSAFLKYTVDGQPFIEFVPKLLIGCHKTSAQALFTLLNARLDVHYLDGLFTSSC